MPKKEKVKNVVKSYILRNTVRLIIGLSVAGVILGGCLIYSDVLKETGNIIRYFGYLFASISILLGVAQFRATHDWNKRQLAIKASWESREMLNESNKILNKAFNYKVRKLSNPILVKEIHAKICKKDGEGSFFRNKDDDLEVDYSDGSQGFIVYEAIQQTLNVYEYLAVGVYQNVFDKEVIRQSYCGTLQRAYYLLHEYIVHVNQDMNSERGNLIWINMVELAEEFIADEKPKASKRELGLGD